MKKTIPTYFGDDSFGYRIETAAGIVSDETTVMININSVNQAPVVQNDQFTFELNDSTTAGFTLDILGNDSDIEDQLNYANVQIISPLFAGTLDLTETGLTFNPAQTGAAGSYSFSYVVLDSDGLMSTEASVSINVTEKTSSGGGSFGFILAGLFSLLMVRRKTTKSVG